MAISTIISGGQTGVDMGALDIALQNNINIGGWCPKGRYNENGSISNCYPLAEAPLENPQCRTTLNILDSDGTLICTFNKEMQEGTALTFNLCTLFKKPVCVVNFNESIEKTVNIAKDFIVTNNIKVLNVAGNRESQSPGIYISTKDFLNALLLELQT